MATLMATQTSHSFAGGEENRYLNSNGAAAVRAAAIGAVDTVPAAYDSETRAIAEAYVALCREGR